MKLFFSLILFSWIAVSGRAIQAQEFRVPDLSRSGHLLEKSFSMPTIRSKQSSPQAQPSHALKPSFVPVSSHNESGLIPVRPRIGTIPQDDLNSYPQARSDDEERILSQIRSGQFDQLDSEGPGSRGSQTIRQRYPDGKDQLVRDVIQDEDGNFYNHGPWRLYNRQSELMASGQFDRGTMDGTWERWHTASAGGIFKTAPFDQFTGPFVSTATFNQGKLDGVWIIYDRYRRKIVEVPYQQGQRHGTATWWYPNSERMRVMNFKNGVLDGPLLEWDKNNRLARNDEFIDGQKVVRTTTFYRPKQKSSESFFLDPALSLKEKDNWWDAEPAEYVREGRRVQHGPARAWHANGQQKMQGNYQNDSRVGRFVWWHENGQKALDGQYSQGQKQGLWTWWHSNGMKSIEGNYQNDDAIGQWTWWDRTGKVRNREDFGDGNGSGVLVDPTFDSNAAENQTSDDSKTDDVTNSNDQSETDAAPAQPLTLDEGNDATKPPGEGLEQMEEIRPVELPDGGDDN